MMPLEPGRAVERIQVIITVLIQNLLNLNSWNES
jgi:hypothetical protein